MASSDESVFAFQVSLSHKQLEAVQRCAQSARLPDFLLDKGMSWFAAISGKRGRSLQFSDAAIQFCLTIKNLFGLGL